MADYIPSRDADARVWFNTLDNFITSNGVSNGMTAPQVAAFTSAVADFGAALDDVAALEAALAAAIQQKKIARAEAERLARLARQTMDPNLDNVERAAAGFTVLGAGAPPPPVPLSRPVAQIDTSKPLQHTVNFADQGTPTTRAKPDGVIHAEIWCKIGDPAPTSNAQCQLLGIDTRTPYIKTFEGADAGKQAHYLLRWISTKGQPGPWSELHSATITGV